MGGLRPPEKAGELTQGYLGASTAPGRKKAPRTVLGAQGSRTGGNGYRISRATSMVTRPCEPGIPVTAPVWMRA